jgi:molybdopterin-guanine dinucleotide biosynthesis protein A
MIGELPAASGIVLAGGRSTRFGRDKLVEPLGGRPLVHHAVLAVAQTTVEVLVVIGPIGDGPALPDAREAGVPIRVVRDPTTDGGPLVGLLAGLERARESSVVVAGGDMPSLAPDVIRALLRSLAASADADAVALERRGRREPLPIVLRTGAATTVAARLLADGERSLRALLAALRTRDLAEGDWRPLDPDGTTLRDIDVPADLDRSGDERQDRRRT